jgi:hypothetical protein
MTRTQWSNPDFRRRYYQKRKRAGRQTRPVRYGIFADELHTYRHNGRTYFCVFPGV